MQGAFDVNSVRGPTLPWLRSIDGFNTHDDGFELGIAGGVTSAQILPGSGNSIGQWPLWVISLASPTHQVSCNLVGGQAFFVKLRKTLERSPSSMVIEPPYGLNGTEPDPDKPRWRHMK